jgi:hypothetical protein
MFERLFDRCGRAVQPPLQAADCLFQLFPRGIRTRLFLLARSLAFLGFDLAVLGFFFFEPRIVVRLVFNV